ncbi:FAD-dependent monooxygenase [Nocardia salmonicida]|uniref:FAD-dependent monooxygenase n=1 Tax=Nocardia salmonicida TaxID=53431 RepID=UPI003CEEA540
MSNDPRIPVVIVGGGLVGMASACFLAQHGIRCLVVEKRQTLSSQPRSRGINPRTMELMRELGVDATIRTSASAIAMRSNAGIIAMESLAGKDLGALQDRYLINIDADLSDLTPAEWSLCHQGELEPLLAAHAAELGVTVEFGAEMTRIAQDNNGVRVRIQQKTSAERDIQASYVIAADGAGSPIRQGLGIPFAGDSARGHFMSIHFRADLRRPLRGRQFMMAYTFHPRRATLTPLDNAENWVIHAMFDPATEPAESFDNERCTEVVRAITGVPGLAVEILGSGPWRSGAAVADRFRQGRVFLVGDAAHVMPPTGAFGANIGIQDAHNLAWKLAAVLQGTAGEALLDTYDSERRPIAEATVRQSVLRSADRPRLAQETPPPPDPEIVTDAQVWFGGRQLGATAATIDEPLEFWPPRPDGSIGTRAPHVPMLQAGRAISTIDLFGTEFVLFTGAESTDWQKACVTVAERLGILIQHYRIAPNGEERHPINMRQGSTLTDTLHDHKSLWHDAYGVGTFGAVLVRPDGVVAWRFPGKADNAAAAFTAVLCRVLSI